MYHTQVFNCKFPQLTIFAPYNTDHLVEDLTEFLIQHKHPPDFVGLSNIDDIQNAAFVIKLKKAENTILAPLHSIIAVLPDDVDILILHPNVFKMFFQPRVTE